MAAPQFAITTQAYGLISRTVGSRAAETGGIIGRKGPVVTAFHFDRLANTDYKTYTPHTPSLDRVIDEDWGKSDITFCGFVHSHSHSPEPSAADEKYIMEIFRRLEPVAPFFLCIATGTGADFRLYAYLVTEEGLLPCETVIV